MNGTAALQRIGGVVREPSQLDLFRLFLLLATLATATVRSGFRNSSIVDLRCQSVGSFTTCSRHNREMVTSAMAHAP